MARECSWGCYHGVTGKCPAYAQLSGDAPECKSESRKFSPEKLKGKGCQCKVAGSGDTMESMEVNEQDQQRGEDEARRLFGQGAQGNASDPLYERPPQDSLVSPLPATLHWHPLPFNFSGLNFLLS